MIRQLEQGEVGKRVWFNSNVPGEVRNYRASTKATNFPDWAYVFPCYKKGIDTRVQRRETYDILNKVRYLEPITLKQQQLFKDMYQGFGKDYYKDLTEEEDYKLYELEQQILKDRRNEN